ncbi:MAG: tetratricopeptide repeat protein [Firmicutes bacterium]|nr:tetratricopeptide repeat protein [Bacillota bacterium]
MTVLTTQDTSALTVAEESWEQVVARLEGTITSAKPEQLLDLGQAYLTGRLVGSAEECFSAALKLYPGLSRAHYYLGCLYSRQGRYREAAVEFRKCLAAQPRNGHVYAELGLVYFKQGKLQEARALWQQGLLLAKEERPLIELLEHMSFSVVLDEEERVVPNLCRMALLAVETDENLALSYLERARNLEPFNPAVFVDYARVFAATQKHDKAEAAWQEAIRLDPSEPAWQAGFAEYLLDRDLCRDARLWAERAVGLAPREAKYHILLAQAEAKVGNLEAAELHLKCALKSEPEEPAGNYELGRLLWQKREFAAALCCLRRATRAGNSEAHSFLVHLQKKTWKNSANRITGKGG